MTQFDAERWGSPAQLLLFDSPASKPTRASGGHSCGRQTGGGREIYGELSDHRSCKLEPEKEARRRASKAKNAQMTLKQ